MRFKLFTHNDLDAAGCAILARLAFGANVDIEYFQNPDQVSERLEKFVEFDQRTQKFEHEDYDMAFVTDISFNEQIAHVINNSSLGKKILVFDHHPTAKHLDKYEWANIRTADFNGKKPCGTSLFYSYLASHDLHVAPYWFINLVREYDTWEWEEKGNMMAKRLANLCELYGIEAFTEKYVSSFKKSRFISPDQVFDDKDKAVLEAEELKIERYIAGKAKEILETDICGYKAAVLFAEQYHSELGNEIGKKFPEYDLVAMVNFSRGGVSFRTRRDDINLSEVAKSFGGGGHPKASGCPLPAGKKISFLDSLFKK